MKDCQRSAEEDIIDGRRRRLFYREAHEILEEKLSGVVDGGEVESLETRHMSVRR
jgi:hypothetical protein